MTTTTTTATTCSHPSVCADDSQYARSGGGWCERCDAEMERRWDMDVDDNAFHYWAEVDNAPKPWRYA